MSTPYWLCLFAFIDVRGVDLLTMGSYFPSHPCVQWRAQSFFYPCVCWMRWCTPPPRTIITLNRVQADTIQMAFYQLHMFTFSVPALPLITETPAHMGNFSRSLSKKPIESHSCVFIVRIITIFYLCLSGYGPCISSKYHGLAHKMFVHKLQSLLQVKLLRRGHMLTYVWE